MKEYSLYIFDFDNTLIDTTEASAECYQHALNAVGIEFDEKDIGPFMGEFLDKTYLRYFDNMDGYQVFEDAFYFKAKEVMQHKALIFDDSYSTLAGLKKANKVLALATNKDRHLTKVLLERFGIDVFFDYVLTCDDVVNKKPHPEVILRCLEHFATSDAVYIGDSKNDIIAAINANINSVLVGRNNEMLDIATYNITTLSQLLDID